MIKVYESRNIPAGFYNRVVSIKFDTIDDIIDYIDKDKRYSVIDSNNQEINVKAIDGRKFTLTPYKDQRDGKYFIR